MAIQEKHIELIERYLRNELNTSELSEFNNLLIKDPAFKKELEWQKGFENAINEEGNKDLKSQLQQFETKSIKEENAPKEAQIKTLKTSQSNIRSLRKILSGVAASFAVLMCAFWFMNQSTPISGDQLFKDNFQAYPNEIVKIERGTDEIDALQKTMLKYQNGNYTAALIDFEKILDDNPTEEIEFYAAVSHLAIDNATHGLKMLNKIERNQNFKFGEALKWYKALALLKTGQTEEAKKYLIGITNSKQRYQRSKAEKLLKILEEK